MGFLDECYKLFGSRDLYAVLGIDKSASPVDIRRSYHKCALRFHPDKAASSEESAEAKFQAVNRAYHVLKNEESKRAYDDTGEVDHGDDAFSDRPPDQSWADYFAERFSKVSADLLEEDRKSYQGSDTERCDVKTAYQRHKGNMDRILEEIPHCSIVDGDDDRISVIIHDLIKAGEIKAEKAFTKESKSKRASRKTSAQREADEASTLREKILGSSKAGESMDLVAMIKRRQSERGSLSSLLSEGIGDDPLSDAEFEATRRKIDEGRRKKSKKV